MVDDGRDRAGQHCDFEAKVEGRRQRPAARLPPRAPAGRSGTASSTPWPSSYTVYAPEHPGHRRDRPRIDLRHRRACGISCSSTTSCSTRSGLSAAPLVGSSFGGHDGLRARGAPPDAGQQAGAARSDRSLARRRARRSLHAPFTRTSCERRCSTTSMPSRCRRSLDASRPEARAGGRIADIGLGARLDGQVRLADPRQGLEEAPPPHHRADP